MCWGVEYFRDSELVTVYFEQKNPLLPVRLRGGRVVFVKWGARRAGIGVEDDTGPGHIATWQDGAWAPRELINTYAWQRYDPKPVKIAVARFVVVDEQHLPRWFVLERGQYLQGLLAKAGGERRVYVVTVPPPKELAGAVWPRILNTSHT
jgi:hypothetical protein